MVSAEPSIDDAISRLEYIRNTPQCWKRPQRKRPANLLLDVEIHGTRYVVSYTALGYRKGYIKVPRHHAWFGLRYDDPQLSQVQVHGGLTFSEKGLPGMIQRFSYQWWIGFDCAHAGDAPDEELMSADHRLFHGRVPTFQGDVVRDTTYVERECLDLIEQLREADRS